MPETGSLIVQGDMTVLADTHASLFEEARAELSAFANLERSPEHVHTYRITRLSLWNAAAAGITADGVLDSLRRHSRYELPDSVPRLVREAMGAWGTLRLVARPGGAEPGREVSPEEGALLLVCADDALEREIAATKCLARTLAPVPGGFALRAVDRGEVKRELARLGLPVADEAPLDSGEPLALSLLSTSRSGAPFSLRPYQREAVEAFFGGGRPGNGYGVIALPCGSGKTVVGIAAIAAAGKRALVVTANAQAVRQWISELRDKTDLDPEQVGEYSGQAKSVKPVTVATYQILSWRPTKDGPFPHFALFRAGGWGLVIFDEVHLLPAPVFRVVAEIQATRRLGLTATLVREDGREEDVFTLVGPKRFDVPWKQLEREGWIAEANCREIRLPMSARDEERYAVASPRERVRIASENPAKLEVMRELLAHHEGEPSLVIGQYLSQLERAAKELGAPLVTGRTPEAERSRLYDAFRSGEIRVLVVSKVANFAIDLPDASVAIQLSGTFGSRQEEAQRLGRVLRPKGRPSWFYALVSRYTVEEDYASNRRVFLVEQGYRYSIEAREAADQASSAGDAALAGIPGGTLALAGPAEDAR